MYRLFLLLSSLAALILFSPQVWADDDAPVSSTKKAKKKKSTERNVRKAASNKRKALREMGVKNVRVKAPGDWPRKVAVPKDTELQEQPLPPGRTGHMYASNNFVYFSPVKLESSAQKTVARLCECAFAANKAISEVIPVPRPSTDRGGRKFVVTLQPTMAAYHAAGGPKGSAGVFFGQYRKGARPIKETDIAMDQVMIPFQSLGLGSTGAVEREDIDTHALVHELTHQQFLLNTLPIWANEGWAEYVGYVPYVGEDLDFDRGFSLILHEAKKRSAANALDYEFKMADFLTMDQQTMYGYMSQGKDTYMLATLMVTFYVHLDGKRGLEAMKSYLQALLDGKSNEEAAETLIEPYRSADRMEQAFTRAWKGKKVKISFPKK
ncbi:MAG: hypothetical protein J6J97_07635 [Akkermansia sp.]|nr:hypothetical protein [Akkermansia sp.]